MTPGLRADPAAPAGERGFVLLVVLWTVALLALIGSHITAGARSATVQVSALRAGAVAAATADGLAYEAMFRLLDPSARRWTADGVPRRIVLPRGNGQILITNEAGRLNPNFVGIGVMTALLKAVGATPAQAKPIATAIYEWHLPGSASAAPYQAAHLPYLPPGAKFLDTAELALIPGMTSDLLARLAPHLSVHSDGHMDAAAADPIVAGLLLTLPAAERLMAPDAGAPLVLRIVADAIMPDGAARREVVVRIDLTEEEPAASCEIIAWQ